MSGAAKPVQKSYPSKDRLTYRGVRLRKPATVSRFSATEIKKAVEHAIEKHADGLARSK